MSNRLLSCGLLSLCSLLPVTGLRADRWSDDVRGLTWLQAAQKCASLGMRMPTRAELRDAFLKGDTKQWLGTWYWTAEMSSARAYDVTAVQKGRDGRSILLAHEFSSAGRAYDVSVRDGLIDMDDTDAYGNVRCIN